MDCADAKLRMEPCASGALVPEELALFEEHIAACEGCRLELELVRAMGSTEKPEQAEQPKSDDWTLDRIFGAEAAKGSAAPVAPVAPEPTPAPAQPTPIPAIPETASEPERLTLDSLADGLDAPQAAASAPEPSEAAMIFESTPNPMPPDSAPSPSEMPAPAVPASADVSAAMAAIEPKPEKTARPKTAKADSPDESWDFEPADAKPEAALPEGSLFFAEETLARQGKARKGQSSAKRMLVWGAGAVVGIGLLALSLWIGFFSKQDQRDSTVPLAGTASPAAPDASTPTDSTAAASDGVGEVAPPAETPEVLTQPADEVVAKPPAPLGARALSGTGVPSIPVPSKSASTSVAPRSITGSPAPKSQQSTPSGTASVAPKPGTPKTASGTAPRQPAPADTIDPEQALLRAPPPYEEEDIPFRSTKSGDGKTTTTKTPAPSGTAPTVSKPIEPAPDPAPPVDAVQRPIDRLHLATVAAEQADDLVTLRKLRDTWKGLVRTSVGPDRARAKRELADCYWAIQTLTGRTSDKKDALAAYREYLLNAPAGGADPRTVARMRQLEDALAESK